jgi:hypothetical protein
LADSAKDLAPSAGVPDPHAIGPVDDLGAEELHARVFGVHVDGVLVRGELHV